MPPSQKFTVFDKAWRQNKEERLEATAKLPRGNSAYGKAMVAADGEAKAHLSDGTLSEAADNIANNFMLSPAYATPLVVEGVPATRSSVGRQGIIDLISDDEREMPKPRTRPLENISTMVDLVSDDDDESPRPAKRRRRKRREIVDLVSDEEVCSPIHRKTASYLTRKAPSTKNSGGEPQSAPTTPTSKPLLESSKKMAVNSPFSFSKSQASKKDSPLIPKFIAFPKSNTLSSGWLSSEDENDLLSKSGQIGAETLTRPVRKSFTKGLISYPSKSSTKLPSPTPSNNKSSTVMALASSKSGLLAPSTKSNFSYGNIGDDGKEDTFPSSVSQQSFARPPANSSRIFIDDLLKKSPAQHPVETSKTKLPRSLRDVVPNSASRNDDLLSVAETGARQRTPTIGTETAPLDRDHTYRLFGKLMLQEPTDYLSPRELAELHRLEPLLRNFEGLNPPKQPVHQGIQLAARNARSIILGCKPFFINDMIVSAWEEKTAIEADSWVPQRPAHQLIVPSGSIDAPLEMALHWPSLTTDYPENGEVLDATNPCLGLLIEKAPSYANTLWTDAFLRRETKDDFAAYTDKNIKANKPWIDWIQSNATGKVRLLFGQANRDRFRKNFEGRYEMLDLWGTFDDTSLAILYESRMKRDIQKLVVFAYHPEYFFYQWSKERGRLQDNWMNVAGLLCGHPFGNHTFFEDRAKYYSQTRLFVDYQNQNRARPPTASKKKEPAISANTKALQSLSSGSRSLVNVGNGPLSVLIDMMRVQKQVGVRLGLEHMPPAVLGWLKELGATDEESLWTLHNKYCVTVDMLPKTNLPRGGASMARMPFSVRTTVNEHHRVRETVHPLRGSLSILEVVRDIIKRRWITLNAPRQTQAYKFEDKIIRGEGWMETKCSGCGESELPADRQVRWLKADNSVYIAHITTGCPTPGCKGQCRWQIPVDPEIRWARGNQDGVDSATKKAETGQATKHFGDGSIFERYYTIGDAPVAIRCALCAKNKPNDTNFTVSQDTQPNYTANGTYIGRIWRCDIDKKSRDWLPVDSSIAFMRRRAFTDSVNSGKAVRIDEKA